MPGKQTDAENYENIQNIYSLRKSIIKSKRKSESVKLAHVTAAFESLAHDILFPVRVRLLLIVPLPQHAFPVLLPLLRDCEEAGDRIVYQGRRGLCLTVGS